MQAKPMLVLSKFEAPSPFGPHSRGKISLWASPAMLCAQPEELVTAAGAAAAALAGIPYGWSAIVTYLNAWHAKRQGEGYA